ncbi:orotate phosphoribosyltransferase [Chlorogloeopsis fritschii PCC 9212]|nr:orotate phosphoribosyltransferase [Chlorogloeopsis fritschii]
MTEQADLAQRIYQTSRIIGNFQLRSGATSHEYFDKYLFEADPRLLQDIAQALLPLIPEDAEALAGLEMGGIPIATILSQLSGLPTLFVRKVAKEYGTCKLAEGGAVQRRLVIVEDVVTSGGQIIQSARALRQAGADIVKVISVIDREAGGAANLHQENLDFKSLFTMSDLKATAQFHRGT